MCVFQRTYCQSSFDLFGKAENYNNSNFRLNSLESNPSNFTNSRDWELSVLFGSTLTNDVSGNIYLLSLAKKLGNHYLYARFTPGIEKEFVFNSEILVSDTSEVETTLKTNLQYKEKFGFGYSFDFGSVLSTGFSLRYFNQEFNEETLVPVFTETVSYVETRTEDDQKNYWRSDLGISINPSNKFSLNVSSINLILLKENSGESNVHEMKTDKGALIGIKYAPTEFVNLNANYETTGGFIGGLSLNWNMFGGRITVGSSIFHDENIEPAIAGIAPVVNFSTGLFSATFSGVKYFSSGDNRLLSKFLETGIHNILHNQYSDDRAFLGLNFALSFKPEVSVRFIDVEIKREIFPTLDDDYLNNPFAYGRVVNITDEPVTVKPSSIIASINNESIYSPTVIIQPNDTVSVPFYTNINNDGFSINSRQISQANFYLTVLSDEPDDVMQKPILINNVNSWDGKVINLRHFVSKDLVFANKFAKNILTEEKNRLSNIQNDLSNFEKVKILFNRFVKEMLYVSDPRSSVEYVQFPNETMQIKGGDCDDLSVGFASLLESIGIETAFVDYKADDGVSHVNLLINTGIDPSRSSIITINDKKYFVRKNAVGIDKVWIPMEMTSITNFETAWSLGAEKFSKEAVNELGLVKGKVEIIDIN